MLLTVAFIGFYNGVLDSMGSKDAQWYPSKLFSENIDFYNFYLENYSEWFMRSVPNYYFQLYYLLYPISSVSWENFKLIWFLLNVGLLVLFLFQVKKDFDYDYKTMDLILLPFFIGFPLISVFIVGQSAILILIITYYSWKFRQNKIVLPILLSLLTLKYSFGLPIVFAFFLMGYYRSVILGGLITLLFPLMYSLQFKLNFISTVFLPFKVSTSPTANPLGSGPSDLMSLYGHLFDGPLVGINILSITLLIFIVFLSFATVRYRLDKETILLCSLLFSLFGFYHFGHDYVLFLLIVPFIFKMKYFKFVYGYLLFFSVLPRFIRLLDIATNAGFDVRAFMRNKYYVIFNVTILITFFFLIIIHDVRAKRKGIVQEYV